MGVIDEAVLPSMPMPFSRGTEGPDKHMEETKNAFVSPEQDDLNQEQGFTAAQSEPEEVPSLAPWDPIPLPPAAAMASLDTANLIVEDCVPEDQEAPAKLPSIFFDEGLDDFGRFQPVGCFEHRPSVWTDSCSERKVARKHESSPEDLREPFLGEFDIEGDEEGGTRPSESSPVDGHREQAEQLPFVAPVEPQADRPASQKPTNLDVMCGRGGESNKHPGNIVFREQGQLLKPMYQRAPTRPAKRKIAKQLVNWVTARQGRFMEKGKDGSWGQASDKRSIYKASQFLRTKPKANRA